ncbi:S-layer homology domain-containing protein [Sporosarcina sp. FSL K6-1522]|uniref:S-layer homology domain-containing protein n=1 Tax=Sporosarcina sp. FSL K6-1522 TaxID=2921554 RepID=UPI003159FAA4
MKRFSSLQKIASAALATMLAASAVVFAAPQQTQAEEEETLFFSDVHEDDHFYDAVLSLTARDIIKGYKDGTYRPYQSLTRGQAAKILALTLELDTEDVENPGFTDVNETDEFYGPIAALAQEGIINGYDVEGVKSFKPGNPLTRSQMAKIINLGFELEEETLTDTRFTDVKSDDEFAGYVQALLTHNITTGTTPTTFSPAAFVTRGQMASFVYRSEAAVLPGGLVAEDFGVLGESSYTAGVALTDGQTVSDIEFLAVEWYDHEDNLLALGFLTEKLAGEYPEATQLSMPFDAAFNYEADGYWDVEGDFEGEPTQVVFTVVYANGKEVSVENTRIASGGLVAQDFGFVSGSMYSAGVSFTEGKTLSDVAALTVEWFDHEDNLLVTGTLTDTLAAEYPEATQLSMPFDAAFDYEADGVWEVAGDIKGEPTKVKFTVTYTNGKEVSVENTRVATGDTVEED